MGPTSTSAHCWESHQHAHQAGDIQRASGCLTELSRWVQSYGGNLQGRVPEKRLVHVERKQALEICRVSPESLATDSSIHVCKEIE